MGAKVQENVCEKGYIWIPATYNFENDRYAKSIIDDSVIMWDKIIKKTKSIMAKAVPGKSIPANLNE